MSTFSLVCFAMAGFVYLFLGTVHLLYTFFTDRFHIFDPSTEEAMKKTSPRLTKRTSVWKAWIGFNGSHSTGAMFFGFALIYGSWFLPSMLSPIFLLVALFNSIFYVWLGLKYWFRIPTIGILLSTGLLVAGMIHYLFMSPGAPA